MTDRSNSNIDDVKSELLKQGRCPLCTMTLPCKHYQDANSLHGDTMANKMHQAFGNKLHPKAATDDHYAHVMP